MLPCFCQRFDQNLIGNPVCRGARERRRDSCFVKNNAAAAESFQRFVQLLVQRETYTPSANATKYNQSVVPPAGVRNRLSMDRERASLQKVTGKSLPGS